jgi:uncharacterized membrane protein
MKASVMILTLVLFILAILVFSSGYGTLMKFFGAPSLELLLGFAAWFALELLILSAIGFIMYAADRRAGNVKVKNALFDRLLRIPNDAD